MKHNKFLSLLLSLVLAFSLSIPAFAFTDVSENAWYAEAVDYCAERALMQGVGSDRFDPSAEVTRAMVVTVLHRIFGAPAPAEQGMFSDVAAGIWYADAADWAAGTGLAAGVGDGRFAPEAPVLRQDLAVFLWRLADSPSAEPSVFSDEADVSDYALEAVRWAAGAGLITGMGDGTFSPRGSATRAQLAVILMRLDRSGILDIPDVIDALNAPCGIVSNGSGALLVADSYYHRLWTVKDGTIRSFAGAATAPDDLGTPGGGYMDSKPLRSLFREPWGITPFLNGWAVSDAGNNALRLITDAEVLTINGAPGEAGLATSDMGVVYDRPTGLATDADGCLYVADTGSGSIRRITTEGMVTVYARGLNEPTGLCWHEGSLYVAETGENRILRITDGKAEVLAGTGEEGMDDGEALRASFRSPTGVTVGPDGTVYVADTLNGAVRSIADGMVQTLLRPDDSVDSPVSPMGLALDGAALWVTDHYTGRLLALPIA